VLSYFYERKKFILFIFASIIAFSRVYVGVHYPLDILFGALTGYILSWVVLSFWVVIKMRELKRGRMWVWYASDTPPTI
jgi:membrane-associated phospholipid phosphatase